jgi:glycosyltransferase involved in cell wall biosynthesis
MQPSPGNRIWVVIAAYNEARVIAAVIGDLLRAGYQVVVVDDGSRDATARVAAQAGAAVIKHPVNLGQGAGLQTGIEYALREGADIIVTFDGDGQHRVSDIAGLIDSLHAQRADFVLGSRFLGGVVNQPPSRRLMLHAATWFTRVTTGLCITETHNGLRAMTRRGASHICLRQNRMAHASEIVYDTIIPRNVRVSEAPSYGKPVLVWPASCSRSWLASTCSTCRIVERHLHSMI